MVKRVGMAVGCGLLGLAAFAETYTHNGTADGSVGMTAFNRPESWNNSAGVKASDLVAAGVPVSDIFNATNDFVVLNAIRAWDNGASNRFPCASLTLGSEKTAINIIWKPYTPGYAVIDNCQWVNATLSPNNNRMHVLDGDWTVVGATTRHAFNPNNDADCSLSIRANLHGAADVSVTTTGRRNAAKPSFLALAGDFSDYAGRFVASRLGILGLQSATATGNPDVPRADALSLLDGGAFAVLPGTGELLSRDRGVELASGTNYLWAQGAYANGVVRMPISGAGSLEKIGTGRATLDCAYSAGDLRVSAGTLVVTYGATFAAPSPRFEVAAGATLVISNLALAVRSTIAVEEGGSVVLGGDIPYDAATNVAHPLDMTALTAAQWDALPKPLNIHLSEPMTFPIHETNRLVVATFPSGFALDAGQFTNTTAKTYGLPNTWFEIEADAETGAQRLVYVAKPVVTRVNGEQLMKLDSAFGCLDNKSQYSQNPIWSDGKGAHAGADYLQTVAGELKTWNGYDNNTRRFPGDSLYMTAGNFSLKSAAFVVPNWTLDGSVGFNISGPGGTKPVKFLGGPLTVTAGHTLSLGGSVSGSDGSVFGYELPLELRGGGSLSLTHGKPGYETTLSGTNELFTGAVAFGCTAKTLSLDSPGVVARIAEPSSLGGPLPSFRYDAVTLGNYCFIRPLKSMTLDQSGRGLNLRDGYGGFDVPEGVELVVRQVFRNNVNGPGAMLKKGAGVLKIDQVLRFGYAGTNTIWGVNNNFHVLEGWVRASDDPQVGWRASCVTFFPGAGLAVDVEDVNAYGLYLPGPDALRIAEPAEGEEAAPIEVRLDNASEKLALGRGFTVPLCTVTNTAASLVSSFRLASPAKGWTGRVTATELADEGLVRYDATYSYGGLVLSIR